MLGDGVSTILLKRKVLWRLLVVVSDVKSHHRNPLPFSLSAIDAFDSSHMEYLGSGAKRKKRKIKSHPILGVEPQLFLKNEWNQQRKDAMCFGIAFAQCKKKCPLPA